MLEVEEGVGEIENVFMAVDVGHSRGSVEEEYWRKTMKTTKTKPQDYIYQGSVFNQVAYHHRILPNPNLSIKPSTLTVLHDFFPYTYLDDPSHNL